MGDLTQKKRLKIIDDIKSGHLRYLVATDVAARGLHINDLQLVVNYDLPENAEGYVHRIGRTARQGKQGKAVSLACERFVYGLEAIEKFIGAKIPVRPVTDDLIADDTSHGLRLGGWLRGGRGERRRDGDGGRGRGGQGERRRPQRRPQPVGAHQADSGKAQAGPQPQPNRPAPDPKGDLEARLEYYRRKYGENFEVKK